MHLNLPTRTVAALCIAGPMAALAQTGGDRAASPAQLAPVVVTATRTEALAFDVPASINRIDGSEVRACVGFSVNDRARTVWPARARAAAIRCWARPAPTHPAIRSHTG